MTRYADLIERVAECRTVDSMSSELVAQAMLCGFDFVIANYLVRCPDNESGTLIDNYPIRWQTVSSALPNAVIANDPVLKHLDSSAQPIIWGAETYGQVDMLSTYEKCSSFGLGAGIALSLRGAQNDFLYFGFSLGDKQLSRECVLTEEIGALYSLACAAMGAMSILTQKNKAAHSDVVRLTAREAEALKWTRDGKSAEDCAELLNLSVSTVCFHLASARRKLKASTKHQAVLKAIQLGVLR